MSTAVLVIICFSIAYLLIAFEHTLGLEKTIPALLGGVICWLLIALGNSEVVFEFKDQIGSNLVGHQHLNFGLQNFLGKIAEILVFLIGAMTIVELVDLHNGFSVVTKFIGTEKPKRLMLIVAVLSFFMSSILDNLTTTIVMVSILKRLIADREQRLWFLATVIVSANAGGAWTPIGDVTTTMLWIAGKVSTIPLIIQLVIPSVVCLIIPLAWFMTRPEVNRPVQRGQLNGDHDEDYLGRWRSALMLTVGVGGLISVPIFKGVTHLPPYMGMMLAMSIAWLVSELIHPDNEFKEERGHRYSTMFALSRIEWSSILFFLGILLAVSALESVVLSHGDHGEPVGMLHQFAEVLSATIPNENIVVTLIGILSAIVDNVPLVAASISMYETVPDAPFWHFLAFAAGTGGSILIIGSAAGVAAMGLERINFFWYMKKISFPVLLGYLLGCGVCLLVQYGIAQSGILVIPGAP